MILRTMIGPMLALAVLSGCSSVLSATTASVAGIAGAGIANSFTNSAAGATAIGLGVAAGANAGLKYLERRVHREEQDRIAAVAGPLDPGQVAPWSVVHDIPIESDKQGRVTVTRVMGGGAFACKDIVFSVDAADGKPPSSAFYTATVCHAGSGWKWASAEPATERWGSLQ